MTHDIFGDWNPAPVVAVASVADIARSVEILFAVLFGYRHVFQRLRGVTLHKVARSIRQFG